MSTPPGLSIPDKARRRSSHRRTDSGELDVFEAERYFSVAATDTENLPHNTTTITIPQKYYNTTSNSRQQLGNWRQGRASLDMPRITLSNPLDTHNKDKKKKKHKQPNSPGGKLASFFNSLINQTVSKKNKDSKPGSQSVQDIAEEHSPGGWRRRRRSSISAAFSSTTATRTTKTAMSDIDAKSCSSLVSGFRTPPPYMINTPIKPYKELKNATTPKPYSAVPNLDWLDKKFKALEKYSSSKEGNLEKRVNLVDPEAEVDSRGFRRFMEEDGADSDSSSDLFELQLNYDHHHHLHRQLGYCASDLPVYESTHMDTIKISSANPITSGPFRN